MARSREDEEEELRFTLEPAADDLNQKLYNEVLALLQGVRIRYVSERDYRRGIRG